jgi:hypothetical protein
MLVAHDLEGAIRELKDGRDGEIEVAGIALTRRRRIARRWTTIPQAPPSADVK